MLEGLRASGEGAGQFSALAGSKLAEETSTLAGIYREFREAAVGRLGEHSNRMGQQAVDIWGEILSLGLETRRAMLHLPIAWREFQRLFPGSRALVESGA